MTDKEVERLLFENVALGYMEIVGVGEDGELVFRLTPAGEGRAARLIAANFDGDNPDQVGEPE